MLPNNKDDAWTIYSSINLTKKILYTFFIIYLRWLLLERK